MKTASHTETEPTRGVYATAVYHPETGPYTNLTVESVGCGGLRAASLPNTHRRKVKETP
jgi:hypothetical protein